MDITTILNEVSNDVNAGGSFSKLTTYEQIKNSDNDSMPVIYLEAPLSFVPVTRKHGIFRRWKVRLFFGDIGEFSDQSSDAANKAITSAMLTLSESFINNMMNKVDSYDRKLFSQMSNPEQDEVYNLYDTALTGMYVRFELEELVPYARC